MLKLAAAYSLFLVSAFGLVTIFRWWKHTDRLEKTFCLLYIGGSAFFGFSMLL